MATKNVSTRVITILFLENHQCDPNSSLKSIAVFIISSDKENLEMNSDAYILIRPKWYYYKLATNSGFERCI